MEVHPSQPYVLTCSDDMQVRLWDWDKNWGCANTFEGHAHYVMMARINRAAARTLVAVDPWTWDVLRRAKELHEATDGLFDCTVTSDSRGSLDDLQLTAGNGVVLRRPLAITLDGIAKGYAVDRAIDALRVAGASAGLVNAGGDLRIFGDQMQPIHVRHPGSPGPNAVHGITCYTVLRDARRTVRTTMANQNITLSLPEEDLRDARILAARRGTSAMFSGACLRVPASIFHFFRT
jgi:WD40 repeat protein